MSKKRSFTAILLCVTCLTMPALAQVSPLDFFINQGLIHSPVLKDIGNQVSSTALDSLLVKATHKPQVSYNGLLYYAPVINGIGYSEAITNLSNISSLVYVTQRIFNQRGYETQYAKFGLQNQALRISSKLTENDLKKAITLLYLSACSVLKDLKINRELMTSSKEEESLLNELVNNGLYKQVDYLSFMVEFKTQELLLSDLEIQYGKEVAALHILCGMPDTTHEQLELPEIKLSSPINRTNSPFFERYVVDSLKILNEIQGINLNYKPAVNWFSDAGLLNNMPRDIGKNIGFSVGLSLSVPIYDGHQRKLNEEKLKIAENTRLNYAGFFKQQLNLQLQELYSELRQTQGLLPGVQEQLNYAQAVVKQDEVLLNSGNISITDYVTALKNFISVKRNLNQYQVKILEIITEINYWNQ